MTATEIIERIHDKASSEGFASLTVNERFVWVVASADFETNLGGVSGYLYNSAGDHLPLLAAAFDAIGCPTLASRTRELIAALSTLCDPTDRESRGGTLDSADSALASAMVAFESGIQDCADDYGAKLELFINSWH